MLNILPDATPDEIRRAYHEAARRLHPDVSEEPNAIEIFLDVQKAYEILTDHEKRIQYDQGILQEVNQHLTSRSTESTTNQVRLQIQYSRTQLSTLGEPQLIYVLLQASTLGNESRYISPPLNVCLVLDRSTSMQGERMDTVKATAIGLVRQLRPEDVLSVVAFSDRADVIVPAVRRLDRADAETKIRMLRTAGGTEIFHGLESAFYEVQRNLSSKRINQIILITDGQTFGDEFECLRIADLAAARGIRINVLGIGSNWNDNFLDDLAMRTGGRAIYISRAQDLNDFLKEMFTDMSDVVGDQISLALDLPSGVTLSYAYRLQPDASALPLANSLKLGNLLRESRLVVLLEFTVEPLLRRAYQYEFGRGMFSMQIHSPEQITLTLPIQLTRPVNKLNPDEVPPPEFIQALAYISLYRMQENVHTEISAGNIEAA
ncbi:MAG TPA: VWA domain-containing protein, partial [Anaerolineales bacterium]|nr:VWA domain-containing protein [Anaerolineales bacterium]